jgi:DNA-binding Lrp family transcriptional regulator
VGLSDEAIRKIVKALEDKGIIKRLVVRKANGEMESRDLRMATPLVYSYPPSGTTIPDPPVQPYQTSGIDIPHNNKENIKENIKVTNITDDRFEKFWKTYDKEIEKDRCYGKWKFLSSLEKDKILATIEAYIESKPDPTYRLNPYRYLSNRSWNDAIIKSNVSTEPLKIKEINNSAFEINVPDGW